MAEPNLNRRLQLEAPRRDNDALGGYSQTWVSLGELWGDVDPSAGRAASGLDVSLSLVRFRITVRAAPQGAPSRPKSGQRFRDGARIFQIQAVTEGRAGPKYLDCYAEEELAQ